MNVSESKHLAPEYRAALIVCALLNLGMLFIEGGVGLWIGSVALLADAVDFLEDAAIFGLALVALSWSRPARARVAILQGIAMGAVGLVAVAQIVLRLMKGGAPAYVPLGVVGLLALLVNVYCAYRLVGYRAGDSSMRAIWLSSRNDAVLNIATVAAAGFIAITGSGWPDVIVGTIIACVNLWAAVEVMTAAVRESASQGSAPM